MAKKKILVVEDESIVSKDIQQCLEKLGYNVVEAVDTGEKALEMLEKKNPDLVLMDIMLKGDMTGIETAETIKEIYGVPVIYLTAYADRNTLNKAKVTEPYGYILKPFQEIDLHTSIEMALYKHEKEKEKSREREMLYSLVEKKSSEGSVFIKADSGLVKLKTSEIIYVEAMKDYVNFYTTGSEYRIHCSIKEVNEKLPKPVFLRVQRSYVINVNKIISIEHQMIKLEGTTKEIKVGGNYKEVLYDQLNLI
jgi:DNA-binding LytR/AlgR family response regulator